MGAFDDLIPAKSGGGAFDDLIPKKPEGREAVPELTFGSAARDLASGALQIGPTAVKGVADLARMLTGDTIGKDTSEAMAQGMESIRDTVGSERAAAQRRNFAADMADDSVGIGETIARNKGALSDQLLPTIGSMILPVGAAGVAGKVAQAGRAAQGLDKAALAARVASAQTAAGVGTTAAQNAADTFAELVDKGVPMQDAYVAAGITVPFTLIAGKLTGGGAEVAAARALTGTTAARAGAGQVLKAAGREGAQEMGEELGQMVGEGVATGVAPSLTAAGKQLAVAGTLGAVMGGGVDVASMARNRGTPAAPGAPAEPAAPAAPGATPEAPIDAAEVLGADPSAAPSAPPVEAPRGQPITHPVDGRDVFPDDPLYDAVRAAKGLPPASPTEVPSMGLEPVASTPPTEAAQPAPQDDPFEAEKENLRRIKAISARQNLDLHTDHMRSPGLAATGWSAETPGASAKPAEPDAAQEALTANPTTESALPKIRAVPGLATSFSTETGARLDAAYSLVEADDLVTSHDTNLRTNSAYPQELQPRQRERAASAQQISNIQARLDPARLGMSADAGTGAPIVGDDGLVESGNARTIALKRVYEASGQKAEDYKAYLRANAAQFGLTAEQIDGMRQPVLVRVRTTPVNRAEFARQANASTVAQMAPSEMAKADANRIDAMDDLRPDDAGDFATSREFIRRFMSRLPVTEQAGMIDASGRLSSAGYSRVRNAVLAKAYGDSPVLTRMVESMDDNQRNISKALLIAAPRVAQSRVAIAEGRRFDADITPHLISAADSLSRLKESGTSVDDALAQAGLLGDEYTPETRELIRFLADNVRRPRRMADFIAAYFDVLDAAGDPAQGSLLGAVEPPTTNDLMGAARRSTGENDAASNAPNAQRRNDREAAPAGDNPAGQPADAPGGRGGAEGDGAAGASPNVEGEPQDSDWVKFAPDAGSAGIPRSHLPQFPAEANGALTNFLKARGIKHRIVTIKASRLKPSQAEYSPAKVERAGQVDTGAAIPVSSDGYVIDGHHRWLAKLASNDTIKIMRLDKPLQEVLDAATNFPSAEVDPDSPVAKRAAAVAEFKEAAGDLAQILTKNQRAAMVPETTPELMDTLVRLFGAAIKVVGTDLRAATAWVKDQLRADPTTKPLWNKVAAATYRKAAAQAIEGADLEGDMLGGQPRQAGETDKAYAKRVIDKRLAPADLPERPGDYFDLAAGIVVPIDSVSPSKAGAGAEKGAENGAKRMVAAAAGELSKREPITVRRTGPDKFVVVDGNGTLATVRKYGWKSIPVAVVGEHVAVIDGQTYSAKRDNFKPPRTEEFLQAELLDLARRYIAKFASEAPPLEIDPAERAEAETLIRPLLDRAAQAKASYDQKIIDIAQRTGALGQMLAPLKGMKRAAEKLVLEPRAADGSMDPTALKDLLRSTIVVSTYADAQKVVDEIYREFTVMKGRVKDRTDANIQAPDVTGRRGFLPSGYGDVLINVVMPNGTTAEIQINVPEMLAAKDSEGHKLYEVERNQPMGSEVQKAVEAAQTDFYRAAAAAAAARNAASLEPAADRGSARASRSSPVASSSLNTLPSGNATQSSPEKSETKRQPAGNESGTRTDDIVPAKSAEQAIRQAAEAVPGRAIGEWHPIEVTFNGQTQRFLSNIKRVIQDGKGPQAISLFQIRSGRLMAGRQLEPLAHTYRLTRANELVESGIPYAPTKDEADRWVREFPDQLLATQTPDDLKAKAAREKAAADADAAEQRRLENKAKADAEVDRFQLTGSDRPADAAGQDSLFERKRAKYNPAQGDLFAQQLDLFLDSEPDPSQAGPGVEEARRVAAEALRLLRRSGTVLGRALSGGLAERQRVDLVGQVAKTPADLALLAQVYRDPRFETFRVFFTNSKGAVVAQAGLTSRLPGSTAAIVGRDAREYLRKMLPKAKAAGATGFFMLHNHPSGRSEPSTADENVTRLFALNAAELEPGVKFKGHVVIDTNEYATIDSRGDWMVKKTDFGAPQPHDNGEAWAGTQISSPQDVMELTKRLEVTGDAVTLMVLNFQNRVMQIATVPGAALSGTRAAATTAVRRAILAGTGAKVVAVSRNQAAIDNVVRHRLALDAILVTEDGKAVSAAALAGVAGSARALPDERGVRVTADTSPAFDYLRQEALEERVNRALIRSVVGGRRAAEPAPKMAKTDTPEFKRWFGDSKVVDADGKPLVVYHGTGNDFSTFMPSDGGEYGAGIYMTPDAKGASDYARYRGRTAPNVMPLYVSIQNPAGPAEANNIASWRGEEAVRPELIRRGYDGIIDKFSGQIIAFRPEQVKSAISNTTFDPNNPSILAEPESGNYGESTVNGKKTVLFGQAPTAADRAESLIQKKAATRAPVDAAFKAAARVTGIQRATTMLYGLGARLIDRITPERVKAGVISDYGVPEAVIDQRAQMQGSQRAQLKQAGALLEKLATMTRAESRVAYEWMSGDDTRTADELMKELPEASVKVLEEVRQMVDQLSQEAMRLGQLDPEAFKRHRFAYLRRSYFKHATDLTPQEKTARQRAISILGDQYKGRGMTAKAAMRQVQNIAPEWWKRKLEAGKADTSLKGEKFERLERRAPRGDGTVGLEGMGENTRPGRLLEVHFWPAGEPKPAKYADWESAGTWEVRDTKGGDLVMWRDFTKAERVKMGEIDEARYAIAKTLHRMVHDVEVGRYLEWLSQRYAKKPGEKFTGEIVEASERFKDAFKPGEWVEVPDAKIPGTSVLKYGALAGRYLPGPIWNDLRQVVNGRFQPLGETYQQILSMWKTAKTALSPGVHTNNIMSNFVMADWHDVSAGHVQKALRILLAAHQRDGKGAIGRAGNAAARLGFADREAAIEIMNRYQVSGGNIGGWITQEIANDQLEPIIEALQAEVAATASKAAPQEIGVYAALQHLMHARFGMAWESFKGSRPASAVAAEGKSLIDLYQAEDDVFRLAAWLKAKEAGSSDAEAGKAARKSFLDYSINAPWVAAMRSTAFPFIAYTYRAVPMLLETFAKKPHKIIKLMAAAGALNWLGVMLGGDGDDKERKLLPEEKAGRIWGMVPKLIRMPWNDANGSPVYLDIRRWIPVGDVVDLGAGQAAIGLPPAAYPGGPLVILGEVIFNKSAFTGKPITLETDTAAEKATKLLDHLWKAAMPNVIGIPGTYATEGVVGAVKGRTDAFGREMSVPMAVSSAMGVKLGAYPEDVLRRNLLAKRAAQESEIDKEISALKRQRQTSRIDDEELSEGLQKQNAKKQDLARKLAEQVQ